jgi:hypothetical protein
MRFAVVAVRRFIRNAAGKQEGVVEGHWQRPSAPTAGVMLRRAAPVRCRFVFRRSRVCCICTLYEPSQDKTRQEKTKQDKTKQ